MNKILIAFGTRPEAIKLAPVISEFSKHPDRFTLSICVTAQHREMIDPVLRLFDIKADYDLDIMVENQSLEHVTSSVLTGMAAIIKREMPDFLIIQGDTTTALASSLAAFYNRVKIAHVEAGLRTGNNFNPYPEEFNRKTIDEISDVCFAHTDRAKMNLIEEGISEDKIEITGNTVIDALLDVAGRDFDFAGTPLEAVPFADKKVILVTAHRRESFGEPLEAICHAVKSLAVENSPDLFVVFPVHLNPLVRNTVTTVLMGVDNILMTGPLEYDTFVHLMKNCYFMLTDSGGLQEEGPCMGKPVLVMREFTERPEALEAGTAKLVGTEWGKILENCRHLLEDKNEYERMSKAINPYGDGKASRRIVSFFMNKGQNRHE